MAELTYLEAIQQGIDEEMAKDENVLIFGEDVGGDKGGVFGVTKGLAAKYGDKRVFNTPLTEIAIGGMGVGLGLVIIFYQLSTSSIPKLPACGTAAKATGPCRQFSALHMAAACAAAFITHNQRKRSLLGNQVCGSSPRQIHTTQKA